MIDNKRLQTLGSITIIIYQNNFLTFKILRYLKLVFGFSIKINFLKQPSEKHSEGTEINAKCHGYQFERIRNQFEFEKQISNSETFLFTQITACTKLPLLFPIS